MSEPTLPDSLEEALKQATPAHLCVGMVMLLAEELETRGKIVLTADEDSVGAQLVELVRHMRAVIGQ